jgi:ABC-type multidrug transport system ATPase subunit
MQPLISASGHVKQFEEVKAVDNLSFSVYPGDIYGFLGQNGAGKSTTIRMLLTLITPQQVPLKCLATNCPTTVLKFCVT